MKHSRLREWSVKIAVEAEWVWVCRSGSVCVCVRVSCRATEKWRSSFLDEIFLGLLSQRAVWGWVTAESSVLEIVLLFQEFGLNSVLGHYVNVMVWVKYKMHNSDIIYLYISVNYIQVDDCWRAFLCTLLALHYEQSWVIFFSIL